MLSTYYETDKELEIAEFQERHKARAIPEHNGYNVKSGGVLNINVKRNDTKSRTYVTDCENENSKLLQIADWFDRLSGSSRLSL